MAIIKLETRKNNAGQWEPATMRFAPFTMPFFILEYANGIHYEYMAYSRNVGQKWYGQCPSHWL